MKTYKNQKTKKNLWPTIDWVLSFLILMTLTSIFLIACSSNENGHKTLSTAPGFANNGINGGINGVLPSEANPVGSVIPIAKLALLHPELANDLKIEPVTDEDLQLLMDILSFTNNKFEAVWQIARSIDHKSNQVSGGLKLTHSLFKFVREDLLYNKNIAYNENSAHLSSGANKKYALRKQKGQNEEMFEIFGLRDSNTKTFENITHLGKTILSIKHDLRQNVFFLSYNQNVIPEFVGPKGNSMAQVIPHPNNEPPTCKLSLDFEEMDQSTLVCVNLTYDINANSAYFFRLIQFEPNSEVTLDVPDSHFKTPVILYAQYKKDSLENISSILNEIKVTREQVTFSNKDQEKGNVTPKPDAGTEDFKYDLHSPTLINTKESDDSGSSLKKKVK